MTQSSLRLRGLSLLLLSLMKMLSHLWLCC